MILLGKSKRRSWKKAGGFLKNVKRRKKGGKDQVNLKEQGVLLVVFSMTELDRLFSVCYLFSNSALRLQPDIFFLMMRLV